MNVAHSWVMQGAGDLSINKLSIKPGEELEGLQDGKDHHRLFYVYSTASFDVIVLFLLVHIILHNGFSNNNTTNNKNDFTLKFSSKF